MAFVRDKTAYTRGIGAVDAVDRVTSANRRAQAAKARAMASRDAMLARVAMGAVNLREMGKGAQMTDATITFDTGRAPPPPTTTTTGGGVRQLSTREQLLRDQASRIPGMQTFTQDMTPQPKTPVVVVDPVPDRVGDPASSRPPPPLPLPLPSASGGSGVTGGGGYPGRGGGEGIIIDPVPDTIEPPPSSPASGITGTQIAIGAGILLGAYYLFKKA